MYPLDLASLRGAFAARTRTPTRPVVAGTVWLLGIVSALTDVSSEMVASISSSAPTVFIADAESPAIVAP